MALKEDIQADVHDVLLDELGVDAVYRSADGVEHEVRVELASAPRQPSELTHGRMRAGGPTHLDRRMVLRAPHLHAGETAAAGASVGERGGIVQLRDGDTFAVAAGELGEPGSGDVKLRVSGGIDRPPVGGLWVCEVIR